MTSLKGWLLVLLGGVMAFGGLLRTFTVLGSMQRVLLWGVIAMVGIFLVAFGVQRVVTASAEEPAADPENAVGKTDSRFGRR